MALQYSWQLWGAAAASDVRRIGDDSRTRSSNQHACIHGERCHACSALHATKDENGRKRSKTDLQNRKQKRLVRYISTF
jgi:hypothetical protein